MYAKKTNINYGSKLLEVYQLPKGDYKLSNSQVAQSIRKNPRSFFDWLQGQITQSLTNSELEKNELQTISEINIGTGRPIKGVSFKIAIAYWSYHAGKGNIEAQALLAAGTEETLTRLADEAFGVEKSEEEYHLATTQSVKEFEVVLTVMQRLEEKMDSMENELKLLRPAYEKLEKIESTLEDYPNLKEALDYLVKNAKKAKKRYPLAKWLEDNNLEYLPNGVRSSIGRLISSWCKLVEMKSPKGKYSDAFDPVLRFAVNYKLTKDVK